MSEKRPNESTGYMLNYFHRKIQKMKELKERELQPTVSESLPDSDELPKTLKTETTGVNVDADVAARSDTPGEPKPLPRVVHYTIPNKTSYGNPLDDKNKASKAIKKTRTIDNLKKSFSKADPAASASHQQHQFTLERERSGLRHYLENREARRMSTLLNRSPRAPVNMAASSRRPTARRQWLRNPLTMGDTILPGKPASPVVYLSWP